MIWLHFIGKKYYTINAFVKEAEKIGISRRIDIKRLKNMNWGDTIYLFQGDSKGSVLFGFFKLNNIYGIPSEAVRNLVEKGKISLSSSSDIGKKIERGCGEYIITASYVCNSSLTIKEILEEIEKLGLKKLNLLIGGSFFPHERIKSKIPFQQGFRKFDYEGFIRAYRNQGNNKRVKGQFYIDEEIPEDPELTDQTQKNKIIEIEDYQKK
ncbi:MAG: hypothetical protein AB1397_07790 [bacterium]